MRRTTRNVRLALASLTVACSTVAVIAVGVAPVAASPAQAGAGTYVVQRDDTLFDIARELKVGLDALLAANGLTATSVIHPGMVLQVPAGATPAATSASTRTTGTTGTTGTTSGARSNAAPAGSYVIQRGDSISGIAAKHGLKYGALLKANNMKVDSVLVPGRTLIIPAGGTLVVSPTPAAPGPDNAQMAAQAKVEAVIAFARAQLGKPWEFAKAGPDSFDCSGLTRMAYREIGINLPHSSVLQANRGVAVDWVNEEIQPGDLVFTASTDAPGVIGHVGIAIDSRRWIHAPNSGDFVRQGFIPSDDKIMVVRRFVTP